MAESGQRQAREPKPYDPEMRVFIGCQAEMALLEGALSAAEAGHGRFITSAKPGIGKTRTAQENAASPVLLPHGVNRIEYVPLRAVKGKRWVTLRTKSDLCFIEWPSQRLLVASRCRMA